MARFVALSAAVVLLAACEQPVATTEPALLPAFERSESAPVLQVTLGGKLDLSVFNLTDETYAMPAMKAGDGSVSGRFRARLSDPVLDMQGDVTCLQVQHNMAWVGVLITKSSATSGAFAAGSSFWFRVQDNGEGIDAPIDRISSLNLGGGAARCDEKRTGLQLAWTLHGNVQIH
jgi:hypothetical protein